MDWNLTFDILNALGSSATFGAFLFLFFKDRQKQTQIDRLTDIAKNLKQQNELANQRFKLSIKPKFKIERSFSQGTDGEADFELKNYGSFARLVSFKLDSNDVLSHNEHIPFDMDTESSRKFFLRTKGLKHITDCEYSITIDFEDKANHLYQLLISGRGNMVKIIDSVER